MQFITALFSGADNTYLNAAFALGIVLVLIVIAAWVLKLFTGARGPMRRTARTRRLTVVDSASIDARRQVVIVRRDNVEHLIMTGGPQDLVIESGIPVAEPAAAPSRDTAAAAARTARPAAASAEAASPERTEPADIETPILPERPVSRDKLDRLRDLARPAPLGPRMVLRETGLLRPSERVIPMGPELRVDNSGGAAADSAKTAAIDAGGERLRLGSRGRFFRSVIRGDRA